MKKFISLFLMICIVGAALASCDLIRKYEPPVKQDVNSGDENGPDTGSSNTTPDFPDTEGENNNVEDNTVRLSKNEAYDLLIDSFTDEEKESVTVDPDADMIGQSSGIECYIFNAVKETENEDGETESEDIAYYVSTNAAIYLSLEEENATVSKASKLYTDKNGLSDDDGNAYKIEYVGLILNGDAYCYNFEVYVGEDYVTNFLVSLDGRSYGEQAMKD